MKTNITNCLIEHIFNEFGLLGSNKVSPINKNYETNLKIKIEEDNQISEKIIYGCQTNIATKLFKIVVVNLDNNEYTMIIDFEGAPAYALTNSEPNMIAVSTDRKNWMLCDFYIQATFWAGMEHVKQNFVNFSTIKDAKDQHELLTKFLEFYTNL